MLPNEVTIRGTVQAFNPEARANAEPSLCRIVEGICASTGAECEISYTRQYPTLVNEKTSTQIAEQVGKTVFKEVNTSPQQTMIIEGSAFMLESQPGCYAWIGNGSDDGGRILHNAWFDFNDEVLPFDASYFAGLVECSI